MHYEIWGLDAGNRIAVAPSKPEAVGIVRAFLDAGWNAEDLALGIVPDEDESGDELPPALTGTALRKLVDGVAV